MDSRKTLCVVGSRWWCDRYRLADELGWLDRHFGPFGMVVTGDCRGANELGRKWAEARGLFLRVWDADWSRWGRAAGKRRSTEMVSALPPGSLVAAFVPDGLQDSKGTAFEVFKAVDAGFPVWLVSLARGSSWFCGFPGAEVPLPLFDGSR